MSDVSHTQPASPRIKQMYASRSGPSARCLPSSDPRLTGQFVDWGTRLYQLGLEISHKNNEIAILKKKLVRCCDELYPGGDARKKSHVRVLREKCAAVERKLRLKTEQLASEKEKSSELASEFNNLKRENKMLKNQTSQNKSVQTMSRRTKAVQTQNMKTRNSPLTRNIMVQCTPTQAVSVQVSSSSDDHHTANQNLSKNQAEVQNTKNKNNVKYATSVSIKSPSVVNSMEDPLEVSFVQKFGDGNVKTVVHSNKTFNISEKTFKVSPEQLDNAVVGQVKRVHVQQPHHMLTTSFSRDSDSGVSSIDVLDLHRAYSDAENTVEDFDARAPSSPKRAFESALPSYINSGYYISNQQNRSRKHHDGRLPATPSPTGIRPSATASTPQFLPYHLFRRAPSGWNNNQQVRDDKPIYVHTSEIQLSRFSR